MALIYVAKGILCDMTIFKGSGCQGASPLTRRCHNYLLNPESLGDVPHSKQKPPEGGLNVLQKIKVGFQQHGDARLKELERSVHPNLPRAPFFGEIRISSSPSSVMASTLEVASRATSVIVLPMSVFQSIFF